MKQLMPPKEEKTLNTMRLEIASLSENESFARGAVALFAAQLNPTLDEINDIKTAVSEAVTNCIVHAYCKEKSGRQSAIKTNNNKIVIACDLYKNGITVSVTDFGVGIKNIDRAMEPFFTTKPDDERSGMGFTVMQSFMDTLRVTSNTGGGTTVTMQKFFGRQDIKSGLNNKFNRRSGFQGTGTLSGAVTDSGFLKAESEISEDENGFGFEQAGGYAELRNINTALKNTGRNGNTKDKRVAGDA